MEELLKQTSQTNQARGTLCCIFQRARVAVAKCPTLDGEAHTVDAATLESLLLAYHRIFKRMTSILYTPIHHSICSVYTTRSPPLKA